jgi:hypothetical protein
VGIAVVVLAILTSLAAVAKGVAVVMLAILAAVLRGLQW